jgi:2-phosphoglycerate kinase
METSTRRSCAFIPMSETIVHGREGGLPYSKYLMAQSLSAVGLTPDRAYELARALEERLDARGESRIDVAELTRMAEELVEAEEGAAAARSFRVWRRLDHLERPLVVMLSGTTGVGKSTLATALANRLGINRVLPTDAIRQILRTFFSHEFMPAVHYSSFEAAHAVDPLAGEEGDEDMIGFARQAASVGTGVMAIVDRAAQESTPVVVEGIHALPGLIDERLRARCVVVEAVVVVRDEDMHRAHFTARGAERPAERYLLRFSQIRKLQGHLVQRAEALGVPVVENVNIDRALTEVMDLVLDSIGGVR